MVYIFFSFVQKRHPVCRFPESHQHGNLAEYCYRMEAEVTSNSKLATARAGEEIAMVLSALINSGGGVLIFHLVTEAGHVNDVSLDICHKDIVRLITQPEIGIPENVFNKTITFTKNEVEKEIYFFANETTHLVTHNSNAYYLKQSSPESVVDNNVLIDVIRACRCLNDSICEKHENVARESQIVSMLPNKDTLTANELFPVLESDSETHFCRNYKLNNHSLPDVLNTPSVSSEILELVSALANTKGGSIFLGVTNTATPTVVGYRLTENDQKCTEQCISDILTGKNHERVTIWGHPDRESQYCWKAFFHNVVGNGRKIIEIRVNKCPGGMFCALPVCLDIKGTGEIYEINSFDEWKNRFLHGTSDSDEEHEETDYYHKHFERTEIVDNDTSRDLNMPPPRTSSTIPKPHKQTKSSQQFPWWLSDDDGVVVESLQFDECCSKELADSEMDISTTFSTFPATEAIIERFANIEYLDDTMKEILREHKGDNGVAVFLESVPDTLPTYAILKEVTPVYLVFDLVILKERQPPVIITILKDGCSKEEAKKYSLKLGQLLKRHCSTYMGKSNMKFFFQCQLYFINHGYVHLQQDRVYPKDYQHPTTGTLNTVRYALARILLDCQHITDRYGHIMVKHLSFYQAKLLLNRRSKVLIVTAIAGSGKTVLALEMAYRLKQRHGKTRKIVFLCRSRGLVAFVKSQTTAGEVFDSVIECNSQRITELSTSLFGQYTDIIIDDAHAIPVSGEPTSWVMYNALFSSLRERPTAHAYIFLDPDMQDYRGCTPDYFVTRLEALAGRFFGKHNVQIEYLGKILRNSRRICQFTKACMGTDDYLACLGELCTVRQIPEDGVFFHNVQGRDATLLSRLSNLNQYYSRVDIAILTGNQEDKTWVREAVDGIYATQDATQYSRQGVVVDCADNFQNLKFHVLLFIIPQSWATSCIKFMKYWLSVVPKTARRLEFLLPLHTSQRQDLAELKEAFPSMVNTYNVYARFFLLNSGEVYWYYHRYQSLIWCSTI